MIRGIDVSTYQGQPNWAAVASSGVQFAITKATEGNDFVASTFKSHWSAIKAAGLVRGAYHFARPDLDDPIDEAVFFLEQVGPLHAGDLLALDLEAPDAVGDLSGWARAWLDHVTEQVGFRPFLYSYAPYLIEHGCTSDDALAQHGLWLANYRASMPDPPAGWSFIAMWQHTDRAIVPGVAGPCDESFFNGERAQLLKYGKPGGTAPAGAALIAPARPGHSAPHAGDYVVRSGDTLSGIAAASGTSLAALLAMNPQIADANVIHPGDRVRLPAPTGPATGEIYVVRSGDSLAAIAARLGVSLLALERANPAIPDPNVILPGQRITIP